MVTSIPMCGLVRTWIGDPPYQPYVPYVPQLWEVWPRPGSPPSIPGTTTVTVTGIGIGTKLDRRSKREKAFEDLLRMAVDELIIGDEDALALAELIEEALQK